MVSAIIFETLLEFFPGFIKRSLISFDNLGLGRVVISCIGQYVTQSARPYHLILTSNDWAYQSLTLFIDGISFSPSGKSESSWTL